MKILFRAVVAIATTAMAGAAAAKTTHWLTVAAATGTDKALLQHTLAEATAMIGFKAPLYSWDVACAGVEFRLRELIIVPGLKVSGTFDELVAELKSKAPEANVMLVAKIDACAGKPSVSGCGSLGREPFVYVGNGQLDSLLLAHERGHNMDLKHSTNTTNFMYEKLERYRVTKTPSDCQRFDQATFASISRSTTAPVPGMPAGTVPEPALLMVSEPVSLAATIDESEEMTPEQAAALMQQMQNRIDAAERDSLLSPTAFSVVAIPWVHGMPLEDIRALQPEDVASIRRSLSGAPNPFWPQALLALAVVGEESDVKLLKEALARKLPAASDVAASQALLRIKLNAVEALGVLANRTQSATAVAALQDAVDVTRARQLVGEDAAADLSRYSVKALNLVNTPSTQAFVNRVLSVDREKITPSTLTFGGRDYRVAPLSGNDAEAMRDASRRIREAGVEAYLQKSD